MEMFIYANIMFDCKNLDRRNVSERDVVEGRMER